jgi:hypothetical protein
LSAPVITLRTPGGKSMLAAASPSNAADQGVSGAALRTTVQPAPSAATHFARLICTGAFHGVIAPTTPAASFNTRRRVGIPIAWVTPRSRSNAWSRAWPIVQSMNRIGRSS